MATCKALLEAGANHEWLDEIGKYDTTGTLSELED